MRIRAMTAADLVIVERLEQQLFPSPWRLKQLSDSLHARRQNGGYWMWVAEQLASEEGAVIGASAGTVAGAVVGYLIASHGGGVADLLTIGVDPRQQRSGIGRQLLQRLFERLAPAHIDELFLEVRRSNTAAIALYQRCGLASVGVRKGYYPAATGREDAIVMRYPAAEHGGDC